MVASILNDVSSVKLTDAFAPNVTICFIFIKCIMCIKWSQVPWMFCIVDWLLLLLQLACAIHKLLRDNNIKYYIICWIERLCNVLDVDAGAFFPILSLCRRAIVCDWRIIFVEFKSMNHEKWLNNVLCCEKQLNNFGKQKPAQSHNGISLCVCLSPSLSFVARDNGSDIFFLVSKYQFYTSALYCI